MQPATVTAARAKHPPAGHVEILSTEFAIGWAGAPAGADGAYLVAVLDAQIIGATVGRISRPHLEKARAEGKMNGYGFVLVFNRPVPPDRVDAIQIMSPAAAEPLPLAKAFKRDRCPPLRLFLFGSPRSGTSAMGAALTTALNLAWLGEGHAAPLFAAAADALQGDINALNGLVRYMARERFRGIAVAAARQAYFSMHRSASFLDKTPGGKMINAAPFINECFPGSFFIYLWRNPVANVLSRMVKFGGSFEGHCRQWVLTMTAWAAVREKLPHYLEIRQEDMLAKPDAVADAIASYIGQPDAVADIVAALSSGARERTGAGLGKTTIADTGWTQDQIDIFTRICDPAYAAFNAG